MRISDWSSDVCSSDLRALLRDLRHRHADFRHKATEQRRRHPQTPGQRIADLVASAVGSWRFIIVQSVLLGAWIVGNAITGHTAWDPFPFILLNLLLSFQAAYTAPVIMMSQNRQAALDRQHAERSEERRGGKECVRTCQFRGSPDHSKK